MLRWEILYPLVRIRAVLQYPAEFSSEPGSEVARPESAKGVSGVSPTPFADSGRATQARTEGLHVATAALCICGHGPVRTIVAGRGAAQPRGTDRSFALRGRVSFRHLAFPELRPGVLGRVLPRWKDPGRGQLGWDGPALGSRQRQGTR